MIKFHILIRLTLDPTVRPKIRVQTLLTGASRGSQAVLECQVEGSPRPTTSWMRSDEHNTLTGPKYQMTEEVSGSNTVIMRLKISDVNEKDFGAYKCSGKNNSWRQGRDTFDCLVRTFYYFIG